MEKEKVGRSITLTTATFGRRYPNFQQIVGYSALIRDIPKRELLVDFVPAILTIRKYGRKSNNSRYICVMYRQSSRLLDLQIASAISTSKQKARRG